MIIKSDGRISGVFIVGDGVHISCSKTVTDAVITLMGVYYVFDLEYPKIYSQLLGTLQTHVVGGVQFEGKKVPSIWSSTTHCAKNWQHRYSIIINFYQWKIC